MNAQNARNAGTGGGLRYLTEEATPNMVNQELSHSCQAACARQLLIDVGIHCSEAELLAKIGYIEGWGTTAAATAEVLSELHPIHGFAGGAINPEAFETLMRRTPWIAALKTDRSFVHAVIIDNHEGGVLEVRDPWGLSSVGSGMGLRATISISDFMIHWHWAFNNVVFANRLK